MHVHAQPRLLLCSKAFFPRAIGVEQSDGSIVLGASQVIIVRCLESIAELPPALRGYAMVQSYAYVCCLYVSLRHNHHHHHHHS